MEGADRCKQPLPRHAQPDLTEPDPAVPGHTPPRDA